MSDDALPWDRLGELLKLPPTSRPAEAAGVDQTVAYYAELFGEFGVSLRDEHDLYVAIVAVAIAATALRVAARNQRIPDGCSESGRSVLRALHFTLAHFVPEEVRP